MLYLGFLSVLLQWQGQWRQPVVAGAVQAAWRQQVMLAALPIHLSSQLLLHYAGAGTIDGSPLCASLFFF